MTAWLLRHEIRKTCINEFWHVSCLKYDLRMMISNLSSSHSLLHGNTGVMNYVNISTFILVLVGINSTKSLLFMNRPQGPKGP